jgi:uncharacterized repeat protein (TIGR01451 family)
MAQTAATGADTVILNGWWDTGDSTAVGQGQMTCELTATGFTSVFSGIFRDSIFDSVRVDTGFAFSSLDSLDVPNDTVANTAYDTIYFRYAIQNQGNATDSFRIVAGVHDTSNARYFTPVDFSLVSDSTGADVLLGTDNSIDSAWGDMTLPQEGADTFLVRVVLPGPLNAADDDSLRFDVHVRGHYGAGTYDAWPDTVAGGKVKRVIIDTVGNLWHTHDSPGGGVDTMWEYGDYQRVTNYLTINAPILRLRKSVAATGNLPGDTITYRVYYDNDGSADTKDTVNIVDMLPRGVMFLDTIALYIDQGAGHGVGEKIDVDYMYDSTWRETMPVAAVGSDAYFDTLNAFTGVRFQIPAGIGKHDTTGDAGTDTKEGLVANGSNQDADAGFVTFKVRIR